MKPNNKRMFLFIIILQTVSGICQPILAEDWPTRLHDMHRGGVTSETLTVPLTEAWTYKTSTQPEPAWTESPARQDNYRGYYNLKPRQNFDFRNIRIQLLNSMNKLINKKKNGFTLTEVIVVISLGALIGIMVLAIVTPGLRYIKTTKKIEHLHSDALFLLNKLNYWIKQGKKLTVTSPSTLEIKLPDDSIKEITKDSDNLNLDGVTFNSDNIRVTELNFTQLNRSVRINITLKVDGADKTFSATTTIAQRNSI